MKNARTCLATERESVMIMTRLVFREVVLAISKRMATNSALGAVIRLDEALDEMIGLAHPSITHLSTIQLHTPLALGLLQIY